MSSLSFSRFFGSGFAGVGLSAGLGLGSGFGSGTGVGVGSAFAGASFAGASSGACDSAGASVEGTGAACLSPDVHNLRRKSLLCGAKHQAERKQREQQDMAQQGNLKRLAIGSVDHCFSSDPAVTSETLLSPA
jgi:hypothetical protein